MIGFITVAIVGVREAQVGVRRMETDPAHFLHGEDEEKTAAHPARWSASEKPIDALEANRFTSSLLALGKAQKQLTRNSPVLENVEPSSLESVLQPLSKNPSREL